MYAEQLWGVLSSIIPINLRRISIVAEYLLNICCCTQGCIEGGLWCHAPPFGSPVSIIFIKQYAKLRHGPPPPLCNLGRKLEYKTGLNLGEDLFFWSSPSFGPKTGLNLSGEFFSFWSPLFSSFLAPLLLKILRTLVVVL